MVSDLLPLGVVVVVTDTITSTFAVVPTTNPLGLVDPDVITVEVEDPTGVKTTLLPTRQSLGVYSVTLTLMRHGAWSVRFVVPSGPGAGSNPALILNVERDTTPDDLG